MTETKELEQTVDKFIAESNAELTTQPKKEWDYIATVVYGSYVAHRSTGSQTFQRQCVIRLLSRQAVCEMLLCSQSCFG